MATGIISLEVRKDGPRRGRGWALRYDPDGSRGFLDLPKLPRGVKRGTVTLPVAPGLVQLEDCCGVRGWRLVRECGEVVPVDNGQASVIKRQIGEWIRRGDLPPVPSGGFFPLSTAGNGWVARIMDRDPKYVFAREFVTPCEAGPRAKHYRLPAGVFQVFNRSWKAPGKVFLVVWHDGRTEEVDAAWILRALDARDARDAAIAAEKAAFYAC